MKEILHKEFSFEVLIKPADEKFRGFFKSKAFRDAMVNLNRSCVDFVLKEKKEQRK